MLNTQLIEYRDQNTLLEGYCAYGDQSTQRRPAVIICHDWSGRNDFACRKADKLAELGYVGFALDMFGKGKRGSTKEEKSALIHPFIQDRAKLLQRVMAAVTAVKQLPMVDPAHLGAIGFCFGGLCVLDLARSGSDVKGVVSFHGLLNAPEGLPAKTMTSKVLVLHGYNDPMVTPDQVRHFADEMTHANVDWQIHMYGHTLHAFTNPEANDPGFGTVYNTLAAKRAWESMTLFFKETF